MPYRLHFTSFELSDRASDSLSFSILEFRRTLQQPCVVGGSGIAEIFLYDSGIRDDDRDNSRRFDPAIFQSHLRIRSENY